MATTIPTTATKKTRNSAAIPARRRTLKKAPTRPVESLVPVEEMISEGAEQTKRTARFAGKRLLKPLKEVYFVGLGLADWALEQLGTVEKALAERGQKRNAALGQKASEAGANVSAGVAARYRTARERISTVRETIGDKVSEGIRKLPRRRPAGEQGAEDEPLPAAEPMQA